MDILTYNEKSFLSNMYICLGNKTAFIVDPQISEQAKRLLEEQEVERIVIVLTHEHYDHISGVNWLRDHFECEVIASEKCSKAIEKPETNLAMFFEVLFLHKDEWKKEKYYIDDKYFCRTDTCYKNHIEFEWEGHIVSIWEAPGHSEGGSLICVDNRYLFTGDNLIDGHKVITRLPGGNKKEYKERTLPLLKNFSNKFS